MVLDSQAYRNMAVTREYISIFAVSFGNHQSFVLLRCQNYLARDSERGKKTRQTQEEVGSCLLYTSDAADDC